MPLEKQRSEEMEFMRRLSDAGYDDVLILKPEIAMDILTEKRREIIEEVKASEVESIRDLARRLDRDKATVFRDLEVLFEYGVVDFEEEGQRKKPVMGHENVFIRPITSDV